MILPLPSLLAPVVTHAAVTVEEMQYDGKSAYRVSNVAGRIVVSPHLGRVVEFGLKDGPNMLWQAPKGEFEAKGYRNVGGDKVWYSPQSLWNWPPDSAWDGSAMSATVLPDGIRLAGARGKILPVRLIREIRIDPYAAKVTFLNRLINDGNEPVTVGLWQITQIDRPNVVRLKIDRSTIRPKGFTMLIGKFDPSAATLVGDTMSIRLHASQSLKYGSKGGDGTIDADVNRYRFTTFSTISRRDRYADGDSAKQVYTSSASTGYAELEHLAPLEALDPGQVQQQTVVWRLQPLSN